MLDYIVDDVPSFLRAVVTRTPTGSIVELDGCLEAASMHPYELPRTWPSNQRYAITDESRAACAAALAGIERPRFDVFGLAVHAPTGTYFEAPHFFDSAHAPVIFVHEGFPPDVLDDLVARGIIHVDPIELSPTPGTPG
jgi:hypothetical protein